MRSGAGNACARLHERPCVCRAGLRSRYMNIPAARMRKVKARRELVAGDGFHLDLSLCRQCDGRSAHLTYVARLPVPEGTSPAASKGGWRWLGPPDHKHHAADLSRMGINKDQTASSNQGLRRGVGEIRREPHDPRIRITELFSSVRRMGRNHQPAGFTVHSHLGDRTVRENYLPVATRQELRLASRGAETGAGHLGDS
jgi:hypothetical protein